MQKKILIKNGSVYRAETQTFEKRDLAMEAGRIITAGEDWTPDSVIDAEGCIVSPGLIDVHVHAYDASRSGLHDIDVFCIPNGTTTCVDAGTVGVRDVDAFMKETSGKVTKVLALLHPASEGQMNLPTPENQTPALWEEAAIAAKIEQYRDRIVGIKLRQQDVIQDPYGLRNEHIEAGKKLAEKLGMKVVVHVNNPSNDVQETAEALTDGDVYCHMYAGIRENILDENGKVKPEILAARERGVLFDACNGRTNFLFKVAIPAMSQGFLPDFISSDVNASNYYEQPLTTLPRLMSKYLAMGMSLEQVFHCATLAPAKWMNRAELASLESGNEANVAIFKVKKESTIFRDWQGDTLQGEQVIVPMMTIARGSVVYCQDEMITRFEA